MSNDHDLLQQAYDLVCSSDRPMPAYFTGDNERTKTFGIDFEPLKTEDEYNMASEAWHGVDTFVEAQNATQRTWVVKLGKDAIVGAYIISKLGKPELAEDLEKKLTTENIENFRDKTDDLDVDAVYALKGVQDYIRHCVEEGRRLALIG